MLVKINESLKEMGGEFGFMGNHFSLGVDREEHYID